MKGRRASTECVETPQSSAALLDEEYLENKHFVLALNHYRHWREENVQIWLSIPNKRNKTNENFIFILMLTETQHFLTVFYAF